MKKTKTQLIKKSILKKTLLERDMKISNKAFDKILESVDKFLENTIGKAIRQARISGRKVIKVEDIE